MWTGTGLGQIYGQAPAAAIMDRHWNKGKIHELFMDSYPLGPFVDSHQLGLSSIKAKRGRGNDICAGQLAVCIQRL